jgi:hypothetical protein
MDRSSELCAHQRDGGTVEWRRGNPMDSEDVPPRAGRRGRERMDSDVRSPWSVLQGRYEHIYAAIAGRVESPTDHPDSWPLPRYKRPSCVLRVNEYACMYVFLKKNY